jgi:hypothetical protein
MSITDLSPAGPHSAEAPVARLARRLNPAQVVGLSVVTAVAVNVLIWAVGALAGGDFEYTDGDATLSAAPGGVIMLTAVPLAVGMGLAALLAPRWPAVVRVAQVVGSALALVTIGGTIASDFDGVSTVALALTHVAIVPVLVIGFEVLRERMLDRPQRSRPGAEASAGVGD